MGFWDKLFGSEPKREPSPPPPIPQKPKQTLPASDIPYGLAAKPMPQGEDLNVLLPRQVGPFTRDPMQPVAPGAPIYGNYQAGGRTIFVELGIGANATESEASFATAKDESLSDPPDPSVVLIEQPDLCFFRTVGAEGAFAAWTRGRYYFSAHAKGGENVLDEFIRAFPY
jgi:hypothetical protein